jgi:hypothetical protein
LKTAPNGLEVGAVVYAKSAPCFRDRVGSGHATLHEQLGSRLEMKANFLVCLLGFGLEQGKAKETSDAAFPAHA